MSMGPLLALLSRLTSTRAANLDNIDATITSRASASDYTATRAAKLDNLDTTVSSRASATDLATVDSNVDAIKADTDAYLDAAVSGCAKAADYTATRAANLDYIKEKKSQVFTASGTWTRPTGVTEVSLLLVAGGGSGDYNTDVGGGGGEVGVYKNVYVSSDLTIGVGAGGAPSTGNGGDTIITGTDVFLRVKGGKAGSSGGAGGGDNSAVTCQGGQGGDVATPTNGTNCPGFGAGGATDTATAGGGGSYGVGASSPDSRAAGIGGGGSSDANYDEGGDGYCAIFWEE